MCSRFTVRKMAYWFLLIVPLLGSILYERPARGDTVFSVDCTKPNQSITKALAQAAGLTGPITISVTGTCNENPIITLDNVTLVTTTGATIDGPDATSATILVRADRVVINGFTVTGGSVGLAVTGSQRLTIENCTVENTGNIGIVFQQGSAGTVDNCTIQNNPRQGILAIGATGVSVTNSVISNNGTAGIGPGIHICCGIAAKIGVNLNGHLAGNQILNNVGAGILIAESGSALIGGNTISGNGSSNTEVLGQDGISIFEADADVAGGNTISGNMHFGISIRASRLSLGDPSTGFTSQNSVTGNQNGGINAFLNSSVTLQDADLSNNIGPGLRAVIRSAVVSSNTTINNNTGDGIQLTTGGALFLFPHVKVTGNSGFGLHCFFGVSNFGGDTSGIVSNVLGNISPGCSGF